MLRVERGLMWVHDDVDCAAVLFEQVKDIATQVLPHVTDFSLCVQAGGNCGLFPLVLSRSFVHVITAEPDPANFEALHANTSAHQEIGMITIMNCAFSDKSGVVGLVVEPGNCGATFISPHAYSGVIDCNTALARRIDDIGLGECGLIYLDVEGYEELALKGAVETIAKYSPTIVLEAKGLAHRYGRDERECERFLGKLGYKVVNKFDNDVVWRRT